MLAPRNRRLDVYVCAILNRDAPEERPDWATVTRGPPTTSPRGDNGHQIRGPDGGTLALINAGLAQGKSRSGLFWLVISLLFGPLATLLIVLLPMPGVEARALGRADWAVLGVVLTVLVGLVVVLMAGGSTGPSTGGG